MKIIKLRSYIADMFFFVILLLCGSSLEAASSEQQLNSLKVEAGFAALAASSASLYGFQLAADYPVWDIHIQGAAPIHVALGGSFETLFTPGNLLHNINGAVNFYYPLLDSGRLGVRLGLPIGIGISAARLPKEPLPGLSNARGPKAYGEFGIRPGLFYFFPNNIGVFGNLGFAGLFNAEGFIPALSAQVTVAYAF